MSPILNKTSLSLYEALKVDKSVNASQLKKAFAKIALESSPDRNMEKANWAELNEKFAFVLFAYEVLRKEETRETYDRFGLKGLRRHGVTVPAGYEFFMAPKTADDVNGPETEASNEKKSAEVPAQAQVAQQNRPNETSNAKVSDVADLLLKMKISATLKKCSLVEERHKLNQEKIRMLKQKIRLARLDRHHGGRDYYKIEIELPSDEFASYKDIIKFAWKKEINSWRESVEK